MRSNDKNEKIVGPISTAVEMLTTVADMEIDKVVFNGVPTTEVKYRKKSPEQQRQNLKWLSSDESEAIKVLNHSFTVLLEYLQNWFSGHIAQPQSLENIKSIMIVVGEAAKKFDRYRNLLDAHPHKSITEFKPYKDLQQFYQYKIMHHVDEATLGKWILGLSRRVLESHAEHIPTEAKVEALHARHQIVDLEAVKQDSEYELFYIRKEDGHHFYNTRLIKNMKLINNFGERLVAISDRAELAAERELISIHAHRLTARNLLSGIEHLCETFYRTAFKFKNKALVNELNKALMALMLASDTNNVTKEFPSKTCKDYFHDFFLFLRTALYTADYHKMITYAPNESNIVDNNLLDLVHGLCRRVYLACDHLQHESEQLSRLITLSHSNLEQVTPEAHNGLRELFFWRQIVNDYEAMTLFLHSQLNGPLTKLISNLEEGNKHAFDPFALDNWPNALFNITFNGHVIKNLRLPSPTYQEYINKAMVLEEFKGFLRSYNKESEYGKHLLLNLQDRSSWRQYFRSIALEDLQLRPEFENNLVVMTLTKESDFYQQLPPYDKDNHAETFLQHLQEQLLDSHTGFYFTPPVTKALLRSFSGEACHTILRLFFSNKNILLPEHRLDFIEVFYLFLTLKIIDLVKPDSISLTCKDGVDISSSNNALLYLFLKMLGPHELNGEQWRCLNMMLYMPALLLRERTIRPEVFTRMSNALKTIEHVYREQGHDNFGKLIREAFGHLYQGGILESIVTP